MCTFSTTLLQFVLFISVNCAHSLALHARRVSSPSTLKGATFIGYGASSNSTLTEFSTSRYATNVTVNGRNFIVAIDTGSSDFWISAPPDFTFNNTGVQTSIIYVAPSVVNGSIGLGSVELGGYSFDKQAFVPATAEHVGLAGILEIGLDGLMGLAFDGTVSSPISASLTSAGGFSASAGQPFLFNIFDQTPDADNFLAISLSRTDDLEGSADGSFLISELDERYAAVTNSTPIPVFPNNRWGLALDAITVNGQPVAIPASVVSNNPAGKLIFLMDSGTPTAFFPTPLFNSIYGSIPGALFSGTTQQWVIPCNTTAIMTVVLGGQSFPIHPLDLSNSMVVDGVAVCTSSFFAADGNTDFDGLFGDAIMRNMYSVFNFGSAIAKAPNGGSTMQLLSQTDPIAAAADVMTVRMASLASGPPEGVPASFGPMTFISPAPVAAAALSRSAANTDTQEGKYATIVIGLLGANLFVLMILLGVGLITCVKRSGKAGARPADYVPVRVRVREYGSEDHEEKRYSE